LIREAPRIETERLILRAWRKNDFLPYRQLLHPAVHRHFGPHPMGLEECWRRVTAAVGGWQLNGLGTWAVECRADCKSYEAPCQSHGAEHNGRNRAHHAERVLRPDAGKATRMCPSFHWCSKIARPGPSS
jgi:RimJ/RimL family protein N-acetyltransferase